MHYIICKQEPSLPPLDKATYVLCDTAMAKASRLFVDCVVVRVDGPPRGNALLTVRAFGFANGRVEFAKECARCDGTGRPAGWYGDCSACIGLGQVPEFGTTLRPPGHSAAMVVRYSGPLGGLP